MKKRIIGTSLAGALALNCLLTVPFTLSAAATKYEFEDGVLTGYTEVATSQSGYSGTGYVDLTGDGAASDHSGDTITVTVTVPADGMYDLYICAAAAYGDGKQHQIVVNGASQGNMEFSGEDFAERKFGAVKLNAGENTIGIVSGWGWTLFDYLTIGEAEVETLNKSNLLSDPDATAEAQGLMNYMATVYGEYIVSGQQETYGGGHNGNYEWEFDYLEDLTGELPAIRGFDFMNYNSLYGWDDGTTERVISWVNDKGGIATASWHINVPKDMSSYNVGDKVDWSNATYGVETDFSPSKILTDTSSKEYLYFMDAVDRLATELKQLQDAGVPLLFRPFHEAEGNGGETNSWFWWGKDGSTTYKALWQLLYKTLTEEYGLHNLVWEFNSYTYSNSFNWYPGNEYVDIVGYDKYNASANNPNESAISTTFNSLVEMYNKFGKPIALTECDTIPSVENMTAENAYWLYFCPWYEGDQDNGKFLTLMNNSDTLISIYQSEKVITLDELPDYKTYEFTGEAFVPETTEPTEPPVPTEPPAEGHAQIIQEDGYVSIKYPSAVGESAYIVVELADGETEASGGLGCNAVVDDVYYWVNTPWSATESGEVLIDFTKPYNVTLGMDPVTDQAIIDAAIAYVQTQTTFQGQVWSGDATITDAYLADVQGSTDPIEDTTEPPTEDEDVVAGTVEDTADGVSISLPQAVGDTLYLQVELATGISYANGCVAANVDVDGTTYWVAVQWVANGSGDIEVDMTEIYQVNLGEEKVTDEAIIAAAAEELLKQSELTGQVWWANDAAGEGVDTSNATITGAYIKAEAATDGPSGDVMYGDVNDDGIVNIADVILLNRALLGDASVEGAGQDAADVDKNGTLEATDSLNILKYIVELLDTLPV